MNGHPTQELLIDYLHGELAPGEDAALLQHLNGCAECRTRYEDEAALSEMLVRYARATECELPAGVRASILDAVEAKPRVTPWWRPAISLPIAAALALAVFAGYSTSHHRVTTIDAAYYLDDHAALTTAVTQSEGNTVPAALYRTENADGAQ
ncbi:MAG TPA: zf-HC2 domain-containing protein [Candidatus Acidoferrales bacterium]|nr:zf-HC2 domain-containing protein [Candidatus Acidoferrales bacterium]